MKNKKYNNSIAFWGEEICRAADRLIESRLKEQAEEILGRCCNSCKNKMEGKRKRKSPPNYPRKDKGEIPTK
jgi:hypothetical protein